MIDPGELREKVTILQKQELPTGGRGQPKYNWVSFASSCYAAFESMVPSDKEVIGKQLVAVGDVMITMRWVSGVTEQMRVQDSLGTVYSIQAVLRGDSSDRYFWTRLHCRPESGA